jgi:CxxC motif-containing protein (DUF1111 family)
MRAHGLRAVAASLTLFALGAAADADAPDPAALTAGPFTTPEQSADAFSIPIAMLAADQTEAWAKGKEQFNEAWVVAPDPGGVWGLGPTFNEDRCSHCHVNNGRARGAHDGQEAERGLLVRLSIPGKTKEGGPNPHPVYGDQLQNRGIQDRVPAEGKVLVHYAVHQVTLSDGEVIELREPRLEFKELQFGELGAQTMTSARVAPAMIGLGLLEAVAEQSLLQIAQQQPEAMRGKLNYVWDFENEQIAVGRFGWKANQPSIRQQTAGAFLGDIGATSSIFPEENCPATQSACLNIPSASKCGGQGGCTGNYRPEVVPSRLSNITLYLQTLAVPARRHFNDPEVKRGAVLFTEARCSVCHVAQMTTSPKPAIRAAANIEFHPYTDLLLHDMGEALADGRPDYLASGREWRTAPLWGIGLLQTVNGHVDLLHDGRARNVMEAILWHGGQAQAPRDAFTAMSKADRAALVKFVESL